MTSASLRATYAGRCVVVLGASGFIGRWVVRALTDIGSDVVAVGRNARAVDVALRLAGTSAETVVADLAQPHAMRDLLASARPAAVFNLSGYGVDTSEREEALAIALNTSLPAAIAVAMADLTHDGWRGQQVIHAGSALEYGTATGDLVETTVGTPTTLYGQTKLAGTARLRQTAQALGVRAVTARLFTVFGPGEHDGRLLPSILSGASSAGAIPLSAGTQERDFTYVSDVVDGLLRLGALGDNDAGIVNLATGALTTVRRFVEIASRVAGIAPERLAFGAMPTRTEEMRHDPVNVERLRSFTGWLPPTTIEDGVRRTLST